MTEGEPKTVRPSARTVQRFIFSYYGFVTACFAVVWLVVIRQRLHWWEYACVALLNCAAYIDRRRNQSELPVLILLYVQLAVTILISVGLIAFLFFPAIRRYLP